MKILITGAGGYIGEYLSKMLVRDGYEVFPVFSARSKVDGGLKLDLTLKESIKKLVEFDFDVMLHTAAKVPGINGVLDNKTLEQNNILMDRNITKLAKKKGAFVIYLSTCGLYKWDLPDIKDEMSDLNPLTPYYNSKLIGEKTIRDCDKSCVLRLSSPYEISNLPNNVLFC
jgi:dTDP-4-dehydrorhamnose reductase